MKKIGIYLLIFSILAIAIVGYAIKHVGKEEIIKITSEKRIEKAPQKPKEAIPLAERKVSRTEKNGQIARTADFELKDINGKAFRLSDYSGNIIILNFFATWCPPCKVEMPDFNQITREYANDVTVIAVNVGNEPPSKVTDFVRANGLRFIIAIDDGYVSRLYGPIRAIPVTYVIDKNFNIARKYVGARSKEVFVKDIESLK